MAEQEKKPEQKKPEELETLVRILGYDIPGSKKILPGLTRIKGVSWTISNAVCQKLKLGNEKKISELSKQEIQKVESFLKSLESLPDFIKNRRKDLETGETKHLYGSDLDMRKDFDIKRLKKIRAYRGMRHATNLPVRGQRTRSNFRSKGRKAVGVTKKAR
jgi:small subunit ribosomal protein S13